MTDSPLGRDTPVGGVDGLLAGGDTAGTFHAYIRNSLVVAHDSWRPPHQRESIIPTGARIPLASYSSVDRHYRNQREIMTEISANERDAPLSIDIDRDDDLHEDAEAAAKAIYGSIEVVDLLAKTPTDALRGSGWTQEDIRLFEDAVRAGESLFDTEAWPEPFCSDGFDALRTPLEDELRASLAPVAPVFGVDLEVSRDGQLSRTARQYLTSRIENGWFQ